MTTDYSNRASEQEAWSLPQWLTYLESIHPHNIDMGLERVLQVVKRLGLDFSASKIVTVAGTNGKGTTCTIIEQGALLAGKTVGVYSSPHLLDYKERVRVGGVMLSDQAHCAAFAKVEKAREDISLTYFEFGTLAAMQILADMKLDILLLEVGLGGRLDAVNVLDADIAVITSIDIDHQAWLGDSRETIATEKAGIFRQGGYAVIGEPNPPNSLIEISQQLGLNALWQGRDFSFRQDNNHWCWQSAARTIDNIPLPQIPMQNASTALAVMTWLSLSLSDEQIRQLVEKTSMPGRCQVLQSGPTVMVDVAHNPEASRYLARKIKGMTYRRLYLVAAMLEDKDIHNSLLPLFELDGSWLVGSLDVPRGASSTKLKSVLAGQQIVLEFDTVLGAYQQALTLADKNDLIVVFGSFFTVAQVVQATK